MATLVYRYNDQRIFTRSIEADIDPQETKLKIAAALRAEREKLKEGEELSEQEKIAIVNATEKVTLCPGKATYTKPPELKEDQLALWIPDPDQIGNQEGTWKIIENIIGEWYEKSTGHAYYIDDALDLEFEKSLFTRQLPIEFGKWNETENKWIINLEEKKAHEAKVIEMSRQDWYQKNTDSVLLEALREKVTAGTIDLGLDVEQLNASIEDMKTNIFPKG